MSASMQGVLARLTYRIAAWLSANWVETIAASGQHQAGVVAELPNPLTPAAPHEIACPIVSVAATGNSPDVNLAATTTVENSAILPDRRLAARLAAVSKLNPPTTRASHRGASVAVAGRAVPIVVVPKAKNTKDTRLPTAFRTRNMSRPQSSSAVVIDLNSARQRAGLRLMKRAA